MKRLKAAIPSIIDFYLDTWGVIYNQRGEIVEPVKGISTQGDVLMLRYPCYKQVKKGKKLTDQVKRVWVTIPLSKLMWLTFNPDQPIEKGELIVRKDKMTYPYRLTNLIKMTNSEFVKKNNKSNQLNGFVKGSPGDRTFYKDFNKGELKLLKTRLAREGTTGKHWAKVYGVSEMAISRAKKALLTTEIKETD